VGGSAGGFVKVVAASFVNRGIIYALGQDGTGIVHYYHQPAGGGGAGAGGTLVFRVGSFENIGAITANGGNGGPGNDGSHEYFTSTCSTVRFGGGGGGGGGRIFIGGPPAGGSPTIVARGTMTVAGGTGGAGGCGQPAGANGSAGWIQPPP
jgi:hypothetical protein